MATKHFSITYYPTPDKIFWPWDPNNLNNDNVKKYEKNCKFCRKMLKFMMTKTCKPLHYHKKLCSNLSSNPLSNPRGGFLTARAKKLKNFQEFLNCKNDKCFQKA